MVGVVIIYIIYLNIVKIYFSVNILQFQVHSFANYGSIGSNDAHKYSPGKIVGFEIILT